MKNLELKMIKLAFGLAFLSTLSGVAAHAQGGSGSVGGGGGDEIEFVYMGNAIKQWLKTENLNHTLGEKLGMSDQAAGELTSKYEKAMQQVANRLAFSNEAIMVEGLPRVCKREVGTSDQAKIQCDRNEWRKLLIGVKFGIVFHEYLGIAGYEPNQNSYSDYPISPKLVGYAMGGSLLSQPLSYTRRGQSFKLPLPKRSGSIQLTASSDGTWDTGVVTFDGIKHTRSSFSAQETTSIKISTAQSQSIRLWAKLTRPPGSLLYKIIIDGAVLKEGLIDFNENDSLLSPIIFNLELL